MSKERFLLSAAFACFFSHAAVYGQVPDALHQQCLKAADYQGCIKANSGDSGRSSQESSSSGVDRFGLPLLDKKRFIGPEPIASRSGTSADLYTDAKSFRLLKHNGSYGRYMAYETIVRFYKNPSAETPGYSVPIGGGSTSCYGSAYGNSFGSFGSAYGSSNCYSTPPTAMYVPGSPGSAGGGMQYTNIAVLDCVDMTYQLNRKGRWSKISQPGRDANFCKAAMEGLFPQGEELR